MVSFQGEGVYAVPAVEWMTKSIRASTRLAGDHGQWLAAVIEAMEHGVENRVGTLAFFFRQYAAAIHPWGFVTRGCSLESVNALLDICAHASDLLKQRLRRAKHRCGSLRGQGLLAFPEVETALGRNNAGEFQDGFGLWVIASEAIGCAFLLLTDGQQEISARRLERWRAVATYIRAGLHQRLHPPSLPLLREPARPSSPSSSAVPEETLDAETA